MPKYIPFEEATTILYRADRIIVVGCSGGGKSTLSLKMSKIFDLEFLSIDRDVRWLPGWVERDKQQQRAILKKLVQRDRWVMDGSGASSFDIGLPRTDLVIWMRVSRRVRLVGLARRVIKHFGRVRPDMATGCPERLPDKEFLSYIWNFDKSHAPKFVHNIDVHAPDIPVLVINTLAEADHLLGAT